MEKSFLRKYIREEKQRHTAEEMSASSGDLCRRVLGHPRVMNAGTVLLYWSLPDEVCTHGLMESLVARGKTVLLPRVVSDTEMTLHRFTSVEDMEVGVYGILEPCGDAWSVAELMAMTLPADGEEKGMGAVGIVPGMAFDKDGHRLGRGRGYYDRLLSTVPGLYTIGLCFPFQLLRKVPVERMDIIMDEVLY
jgi:5-formyltetrahydrofolate cyclo-ligase